MELRIEKQKIPMNIAPIDESINNFYIVAIGASAGGLEALEQFFKPVHEKCKMAYVVIQHLDPSRKGMLPELLQRISNLQVIEAKNGMVVMPGMVYVIPPNKLMSISYGVLYLSKMLLNGPGERLPINNFMISLAKDQQENAVGVVLSGMGTDGTLGAIAIKENNGTVLVQDPHDAKFDSMPNNVIARVMEDVVSPASELVNKLHGLLNFIPYHNRVKETEEVEENILEKIIILLRIRTDNDFSEYKRKTILHCIERRMGFNQIDKLNSYYYFIHEDKNEVESLMKCLLIGVTSFFRDSKVWVKMKESILPGLISKHKKDAILRAWVVACSTGEEAYSLAIVFKELVESNEEFKGKTLQIFATDLDTESIDLARKGIYPASIAENVSEERLGRFFIKYENSYKVSPELRKNIVFSQHNINSHPPFTGIDILSCRNLLIYMDTELQQKLLSLFYFCINPEGILLLGSSESIGIERNNFTPVDNLLKFYKRSLSSESTNELLNYQSSLYRKKLSSSKKKKLKNSTQNINELSNKILLKRFSPVGVLVKLSGNIIQIIGHFEKYLEPSIDKIDANIFAILRRDLLAEFSKAFRNAVAKNESVNLNVLIESKGQEHYTNITIKWVDKIEMLSDCLIIVFVDLPLMPKALPVSGKKEETIENSIIWELQKELQYTRGEMQNMLVDMQSLKEEMQSTNEELQSINKELLLSNEELSASLKEMQNLNGKLEIVNDEIQTQMSDYLLKSNEIINLFNSANIPILFLDTQMKIRRYTPEIKALIEITETDIGRPLHEIVSSLIYPELYEHAKEALTSQHIIKKVVQTEDKLWFSLHIAPYYIKARWVDGIVITFFNITDFKHLELKSLNI